MVCSACMRVLCRAVVARRPVLCTNGRSIWIERQLNGESDHIDYYIN